MCASQPPSTSDAARSVSRGTGAPADSSRRTRAHRARWASSSDGRGAHDVAQRGRCGEDERGVDGGDGVGERAGGQRAGLGDVHVGNDRGDAERGTVEGERREGGNQPVLGRDAERVAHEVALRLELRVPVDDALGRTGRAGGEQHGRLAVTGGVVEVGSWRPIWTSSTTV